MLYRFPGKKCIQIIAGKPGLQRMHIVHHTHADNLWRPAFQAVFVVCSNIFEALKLANIQHIELKI
jgi:hypothetical protein